MRVFVIEREIPKMKGIALHPPGFLLVVTDKTLSSFSLCSRWDDGFDDDHEGMWKHLALQYSLLPSSAIFFLCSASI
jgi:hypothetical protein